MRNVTSNISADIYIYTYIIYILTKIIKIEIVITLKIIILYLTVVIVVDMFSLTYVCVYNFRNNHCHFINEITTSMCKMWEGKKK